MNGTSSNSSAVDDVNALYGPGSIVGWYMTLLATVITWMCHPSRASADSIDGDFVFCFALPVLAIGHLVDLTKQVNSGTFQEHSIDAMNAPKWLIKDGFMVGSTMAIAAGLGGCLKRSISASVVAVACWTADLYSDHIFADVYRVDSELDLGADMVGSIVIGSYLCLGPIIAWKPDLISKLFQIVIPKWSSARDGNDSALQPPDLDQVHCFESRRILPGPSCIKNQLQSTLRVSNVLFLVSSAILYGTILSRLQELFPHTRSSLSDYDQLAAIFGGAMILVSNVYLVARYWYSRRQKTWWNVDAEAGSGLEFSTVRTRYSISPELEQDLQAVVGSEPS